MGTSVIATVCVVSIMVAVALLMIMYNLWNSRKLTLLAKSYYQIKYLEHDPMKSSNLTGSSKSSLGKTKNIKGSKTSDNKNSNINTEAESFIKNSTAARKLVGKFRSSKKERKKTVVTNLETDQNLLTTEQNTEVEYIRQTEDFEPRELTDYEKRYSNIFSEIIEDYSTFSRV
eukprot:NODE_716_length_4828_cov_0.189258.p3 type:complete len:173 gc:universal NODE_716_length_4828_cov_0.189258:1730-2248(+)